MRISRAFYSLFFIIYLTHQLTYPVVDQTIRQHISNFTQQYQRPYTLIEFIGSVVDTLDTYSVPLLSPKISAPKPAGKVTTVITLMDDAPRLSRLLKRSNLAHLILLQPTELSTTTLKNLAQCEQPDIVIAHGIPEYLRKSTTNIIELFLILGDYLYIEITPQDRSIFEQYKESPLLLETIIPDSERDKEVPDFFYALFKTNKQGLSMPRWSLEQRVSHTEVKYQVNSTFTHKNMFKKATKQTSDWLAGINLLTFVMMEGTYPSEQSILLQIEAFAQREDLEHNDLVIGNILIQGTKITPIDFNDKRRDIDLERCLKALRVIFRYDLHGWQSPYEKIRYYQNLLVPQKAH